MCCCRRSRLFWCAVLALGLLSLPMLQLFGQGAAKKDIEKLGEDIVAGKKITDDDVKKLVKKFPDLEEVMEAFKPAKKGQPSLESTLERLAKKTTHTPADKATLQKIANLSRGVARLAPHYDEKTKGDKAKKKEWDRYSKDMDEGAAELIKAIKSGDAKAVRAKANKLGGSCTDCHSKFRD
jgi:hypothetical protein